MRPGAGGCGVLPSLFTLVCLVSPSAWAVVVMEIQPGAARPGEAVLLKVRGASAVPRGTLGDRSLLFLPAPGGHEALVGLPVELEPGTLGVLVEVEASPGEEQLRLNGELEVLPAHFNQRELTVAKKFLSPSLAARRRMAGDKAAFARAFSQPTLPRLFRGSFAWPRLSSVTAPFGDVRLFNGKKQSQHFGTDLDGEVGDPVHASNQGQVVMARDCYSSGKTLLLHHGAGVYTAYFHLSQMGVKPGAQVSRGQKLGRVGKTGRVTGPHLHFGVKLGGVWVDPESLLRLELEPGSR